MAYAAPAFSEADELNDAYSQDLVAARSVFVKPSASMTSMASRNFLLRKSSRSFRYFGLSIIPTRPFPLLGVGRDITVVYIRTLRPFGVRAYFDKGCGKFPFSEWAGGLVLPGI